MRVMTVRQPWAWSLIHGGKDIENRSRNIAGSYRGPVAIHVAQAVAHLPAMPLEVAEAIGKWSRSNPGADSRDLPDDPRNARPHWYGHRGSVIGVVNLDSVHFEGDHEGAQCSPWAMDDFWHLCVTDSKPIDPIPATGKLGLWRPSTELENAIREGLRR